MHMGIAAGSGGGNGNEQTSIINDDLFDDVTEKNTNEIGRPTTHAQASNRANGHGHVNANGNGSNRNSNGYSNRNESESGWCLEPELVTADGRYTPIPRFGAHDEYNGGDFVASSASAFSEEDDLCITTNRRGDIHVHGSTSGSTSDMDNNLKLNFSNPIIDTSTDGNTRAKLLSRTKEQLVDEILAMRSRLSSWERLTSQIVSALALAPDSNAMYSRLLRTILCTALKSVASIQHIRHVECSLPSLPTERPELSLITWRNLSDSLWRVNWRPSSWWVSVAASGTKWGLAFNALTKVSHIAICGTLRCRFNDDMTAVRLAFIEEPALEMTVNSEVNMDLSIGIVGVGIGIGIPVPVEEQIEEVIRNELKNFILDTMVGKNSSVIVLRRKPNNPVSKEDLEEAISAAQRANSVQLRSVK